MPTIGDMSYGVDENAANELCSIIDNWAIGSAIENISEIEHACNECWEGVAKERFLTNLRADVAYLVEAILMAKNTITYELNDVTQSMKEFDYNLIDDYK